MSWVTPLPESSSATISRWCVDAPSQVTIGAMCGAEALLVPGERLETFYRTDAACERLGRRLAEHMLAEVYERLLDRYAASPQQRYEALTERCPDVLQLVPCRNWPPIWACVPRR